MYTIHGWSEVKTVLQIIASTSECTSSQHYSQNVPNKHIIWWTCAIAPSSKNCKKYLSNNPCFALQHQAGKPWWVFDFLSLDDDDETDDDAGDAFTCWRCSWLSLRRCLSASPLQHQACRRLPAVIMIFQESSFWLYSFKTLISSANNQLKTKLKTPYSWILNWEIYIIWV